MTSQQCISVDDAKNIILEKGKHKGRRLIDVKNDDPEFLEWLYEHLDKYSSLRAAILICWAKG